MKFEEIKKLSPDLQVIALELVKLGVTLETFVVKVDEIAENVKLLSAGLDALDKATDDCIRVP